MSKLLLIEPFYGGSHRQLMDLLAQEFSCELHTLPAKKWHWKARTAALHFSENIPLCNNSFAALFCSSVLNLAELAALRPDLAKLRKIMYFHENQLEYPLRKVQERDYQFAYNQIVSCMVADEVVFNSAYNMSSFLSKIKPFLNKIPDYKPSNESIDKIRAKSKVLHYPIVFPMPVGSQESSAPTQMLHILWPHRWEHDKNPELLFEVLIELHSESFEFQLSVLGEQYEEVPDIFHDAKEKLKSHILNWGYTESRHAYYEILRSADVVVSTANHEFYGVAMLEATYLGCLPICPNRLVYPEIFPAECLYNTRAQLKKTLAALCKGPHMARHKWRKLAMNFEQFSWDGLKTKYELLFSK